MVVALFGFTILPVWGIVDAAMRPNSVWEAAGQSRLVWVLIQIFLWTLGAALYFIFMRPKLKATPTAPGY